MRTSSNQGHVTAKDIRTQIYHTAPHHTLPWTAPKTTPKAKRKALALEFLQPNLVVIQNLLYRLLLPFLFFIQARRTGFAALKWQAILGKTF
jgi:hypothetical protein